MPQIRETAQTEVPSSQKIDLHRYLPKLSREQLGKLARPLLVLMLLAGPAGLVGAQDNAPDSTEVSSESETLMTIQQAVTLRGAADTEAQAFGSLQIGDQVLVSETMENDGYRWGRILEINGIAPNGDRFIALEAVDGGIVFAVVTTPEAQVVPEAPTEPAVGTEAAGTQEAPTLATVSPTEVAPTITPEILLARELTATQQIIANGSVNTDNVLVTGGFSFGIDSLTVSRAETQDANIRDGVYNRGLPWIQGALSSLGFDQDFIQQYYNSGEAGLFMRGSATDHWLDEGRLGSWGTTMFVKLDDGTMLLIPAFHSTRFSSAENGGIILRDTAIEEAVQGPLYKNLFDLQAMHPDYFAYWGFPDQESLVASLSQNGHLRAFLEYAQHAGLQNAYTGWSGDSYHHQIGNGEVGNTFELRQDVVDLVNTVMGTRYTTLQEVLPYFGNQELLLQLNFNFRQWSERTLGTAHNVWDAFGLQRDGGVSIVPLVNYNF